MFEIKRTQAYLGLVARVYAFEVYKIPRVCEVEGCGKERVEVHHKDKNRENNTRENLKILCKRHHNDEHGVIPIKKERQERLPVDMRKPSKRKAEYNETRKAATEAYKKKWGIV